VVPGVIRLVMFVAYAHNFVRDGVYQILFKLNVKVIEVGKSDFILVLCGTSPKSLKFILPRFLSY
jgi:hypothetical protein